MMPRHLQITIVLLLLGVLLVGGFIFEFQRRERAKTQALPPGDSTRALPAPAAGPAERIRLMVAYDDDGMLVPKEANVALPVEPGDRAKEILRALLALYVARPSPHPLKPDADIKNVFFVNGVLCVVDMNAAFAEGHPSGILVEQFTLASIVETISANFPQVRSVKFLVEGQQRETLAGHADLLTTYEVQKVHDFVLSLQDLDLAAEPPGKDAASK
ncbi:MAG: GerMN domain-containing protein [Terriglobales bacterium]